MAQRKKKKQKKKGRKKGETFLVNSEQHYILNYCTQQNEDNLSLCENKAMFKGLKKTKWGAFFLKTFHYIIPAR